MAFLDEEEPEEEEEPEVIEAEVVDEDSGEGEVVEMPSGNQQQGGLLEPATEDLEEVEKVYEKFEEIKHNLLTKDDREKIGGNIAITKSGWRKIATAFNVSVDITKEKKVVEDGVVKWRIQAKATAPNGKTATGVAMAASNESNHMETLADTKEKVESRTEWSTDHKDVMKIDGAWRRLRDPRAVNEHNIYATAATRAKNRAISDLVGGGEVSAEELDGEDLL